MKKLIIPILLASAVAMALGGVSKTSTVTVANAATEPTLATQGLPVEFSPGGLELRRVIVTAKQPDDGGVEVGDLNAIALRAWKYTVQGKLVDAGTLFIWSRFPEMDVAYASDAGVTATGYAVHNNGLSFTMAVPPMGNLDRIAYTAHGAAAVDAGTINVDLVLEGRYLDALSPHP